MLVFVTSQLKWQRSRATETDPAQLDECDKMAAGGRAEATTSTRAAAPPQIRKGSASKARRRPTLVDALVRPINVGFDRSPSAALGRAEPHAFAIRAPVSRRSIQAARQRSFTYSKNRPEASQVNGSFSATQQVLHTPSATRRQPPRGRRRRSTFEQMLEQRPDWLPWPTDPTDTAVSRSGATVLAHLASHMEERNCARTRAASRRRSR